MSTYTIGEAARRSGFSASALRYYEEIGLVDPSGRTPSGYRLYDERALDRLTFVARAKQLGCSLEEITDLTAVWADQRCGPVQRRFHDLVTAKIRDAEAQAAELRALTEQLRSAAHQLRGEPVDAPCSATCACLAGGAATARQQAPVACTLDPAAVADRRAEWAAVLADVRRRGAIEGGVRLELGTGVDLGALGRLIGAEQHCCEFFHFALVVDASGVVLEVRAPDLAADVVAELFGNAA